MIIAVDYDGTLYANGEINTQLIAKLKQAQRNNDFIILWTCREGKRLVDAVIALKQNGLCPNAVNDNAPAVVQRLGYNPRKVVADIYIDDKAVR